MSTSTPSNPAPAPSEPETDPQTAHFHLAITLTLHSWAALSLAVQHGWGGPASEDKRAWMCGAVAEYFAETAGRTGAAPADDDVAELVAQMLEDEFEVLVEDGSDGEVARRLGAWWREIRAGELRGVRAEWERWKRRRGGEEGVVVVKGEGGAEEEESSSEEDEEGDVDMEEAPELVKAESKRERKVAEVDEEGFTTVVGRRKR